MGRWRHHPFGDGRVEPSATDIASERQYGLELHGCDREPRWRQPRHRDLLADRSSSRDRQLAGWELGPAGTLRGNAGVIMTGQVNVESNTAANSATCRFCGVSRLHTFVDLGMSPPCETILERAQLNEMEAFYPLHVFVCDQCFLVQL